MHRRCHLRAIDCADDTHELVLEHRRLSERDHLVGTIGAVMVVTFVIGSWSLLFTAISAVIGAGRALLICGLVTVGSALMVAILYRMLKRMSDEPAPTDIVVSDDQPPQLWMRTAER